MSATPGQSIRCHLRACARKIGRLAHLPDGIFHLGTHVRLAAFQRLFGPIRFSEPLGQKLGGKCMGPFDVHAAGQIPRPLINMDEQLPLQCIGVNIDADFGEPRSAVSGLNLALDDAQKGSPRRCGVAGYQHIEIPGQRCLDCAGRERRVALQNQLVQVAALPRRSPEPKHSPAHRPPVCRRGKNRGPETPELSIVGSRHDLLVWNCDG